MCNISAYTHSNQRHLKTKNKFSEKFVEYKINLVSLYISFPTDSGVPVNDTSPTDRVFPPVLPCTEVSFAVRLKGIEFL
jgi:hypothetical protein